METDFADWLMVEIRERGWTNSELARRAGVVPSTISMVLSGQQRPGVELCVGLARALDELPERVLRRAGILPPLPPSVEEETEAVAILRELALTTRQTVLAMLRGLARPQSRTAGTHGQRPGYQVDDPLLRELIEEFRRVPQDLKPEVVRQAQIYRRMAEGMMPHIIGEEEDGEEEEGNAEAAA